MDLKAARETLNALWATAQGESVAPKNVPQEILQAISASTNSNTLTYRYVLPTQLLAKFIDPSLDCRALQARSPRPGAFDARSVCHKVIVPFDRENNRVLGGSAEPYLNNPVAQSPHQGLLVAPWAEPNAGEIRGPAHHFGDIQEFCPRPVVALR